MLDEYLKSLSLEYLEICRLMKSGDYDGDAYQRLSADRTNIHNELIRLLGSEYDRPFDMKAYCRSLV